MNILQFFELFVLLVIVSACFCNGWQIITRAGFVFGFWEIFWEKKIGDQKIYKSYEEVKAMFEQLKYLKEDLARKFSGAFVGFFDLWPEKSLSAEEQLTIEKLIDCRLERISGGTFRPYLLAPKYRFPLWLQYPLSRCVTCYASVYGTGIWWVFIFLQKNAFEWAQNKIVAYFVFWAIFTIVLSFLNAVLSKKMK